MAGPTARAGALFSVTVAVLLLAGCQVQPAAGPLQYGGDPTTLCIPTQPDQQIVFGDTVMAPEGSALRIDRVTLIGAKNVKEIAAYVLPIPASGSIGSALYPPTSSPAWSEKVPADGAQLAPGEHMNLVVALERPDDSKAGSLIAVNVTYTEASTAYEKAGTTRVFLKTDCPAT
jgi:hypothetical protein